MRLADLVEILDGLERPETGGDIVVSNDFADDGAVVRLGADEHRGLVLTADVIAPLVDDPETFGAIAATNALSDVYAMGGQPLHALNLVFFPDDLLPGEVLRAILRGVSRACAAAGAVIVGGHTVRDSEIKIGLSVTGVVDLDRVLTNRGARAGQALVLTKALGTGIVGTAIKKEVAAEEEIAAAIASMTTHNGGGLEIARRYEATAGTDVTGFGLLGHLRNILRGSGLAATVYPRRLPLLPGALGHAREGRVPGGSKANLEFLRPFLRVAGEEDALLTLLAADAQTSGGLLLCVAPEVAGALVGELRAAGLDAAEIGGVRDPDAGEEVGDTLLDFRTDG